MAIASKKNANFIFKSVDGDLVHLLPSTKASLVAYGEDSTVAAELQAQAAGIADKADLEHIHGEITSDGKIGDTAGLPLITGEDGLIEAGSFGTTSGTFVEGNDARLSDDRNPLPHEQASSTITSLQGYQKAISASALSASDTLNVALGKLERQLDKVEGVATLGREELSSNAVLTSGTSNEIRIVSCTGEIEVEVPSFDSSTNSAPSSYWIRNAGEDAVTVACGSGASIDGSTDDIELQPGESVLLFADTDGNYSLASDARWQSAVDAKQDAISDLDEIRSNAALAAAMQDKVDSIETGADANVIEIVKVNGSALTVQDKAVDVSVPLASNALPSEDGTASAGTSTAWAREDHVHPSDTTKVDKVEGKGLSANDFTDELLDKVDGIESGSQENVLESITINGSQVTIVDKNASFNVPLASDNTPEMAGEAAAGTSTAWSRSDHVHPSDTTKVDKVDGMGLSTNDFTNDLLNKIEGIEEGSQENVIETISVNGVELSATEKGIDIAIPVASDLDPLMADATASAGAAETWSRSDHVHPSDTTKVDKVEGKDLSTNDFTDALKIKLEGIEESSEENVIETISVNGSPLAVAAKNVNIDVPLAASSDPLMAGVAAVGISTAWAREDHVHPSDTTKVDKVEGKGLSANDFTDALKDKLDGVEGGSQENVIESVTVNGSNLAVSGKNVSFNIPLASDTNPEMNGTASAGSSDSWSRSNHVHPSDTTKVDKVEGKGLSANDFTDALKDKLDGVEEGSQENVLESITINGSAVSIVNKDASFNVPIASDNNPLMAGTASAGTSTAWSRSDHVHPSDTTKVDKVEGKGLSTNDFTDALQAKVNGIEEGSQENVLESITINGSAVSIVNKDASFNVPIASDNNPLMAGTASAGSSTAWSRSDHVHPSDTTKVDKVEGKDLSTNDFTDALKIKLEGIEDNAQENVIESITLNGSTLAVADKGISFSVPLASSTTPLMNGTASDGTETAWAKGDHVHPSDTTKVDKIAGKGLSTNDFTDALKDKLDGIAAGANEYTLPAATTETRGGVVIGSNINVSSGTISVANASTSDKGVVQLTSAVNSDSEVLGATAKAVKTAYALASGKQSPATTLAGYGITDAYTKTEIDQMLSTAMHYRGSVSTYNALPDTGNIVGDFYNVVDTGKNYAYTGTAGDEWDLMGSMTEVTTITSAEIDAMMAEEGE